MNVILNVLTVFFVFQAASFSKNIETTDRLLPSQEIYIYSLDFEEANDNLDFLEDGYIENDNFEEGLKYTLKSYEKTCDFENTMRIIIDNTQKWNANIPLCSLGGYSYILKTRHGSKLCILSININSPGIVGIWSVSSKNSNTLPLFYIKNDVLYEKLRRLSLDVGEFHYIKPCVIPYLNSTGDQCLEEVVAEIRLATGLISPPKVQ